MESVVIIDAVRTPIGAFGGSLSSMTAPELGSVVIGALYKNNGLNPDIVDEVIMGHALPAGTGQAPSRQAAMKAGLKNTIPCTSVNKACISGMKAVMYAMQQIGCGETGIMIAGGMESMSNVPYYLSENRFGAGMGDVRLKDGILNDGLRDAFKNYHLGQAAGMCADEYGISRKDQDDHAIESIRRSRKARDEGLFDAETTSVKIRDSKGHAEVIKNDEVVDRINTEKIPELAPAFEKEGTITTANIFKIGDGAAAMLLMSEKKARELGVTPMARLAGHYNEAHSPEWFSTLPVRTIPKAIDRAGMSVSEIELFEIHEICSASTLANIKLLEIDPDHVNIHGGAVSIGHPIGCSGARILVTLLHALRQNKHKRGCAAIAGGGGEAAAMVLELFD